MAVTSAIVKTKSIVRFINFKDRTFYYRSARIQSDAKVLASNMIILAVFADKPDRRYPAEFAFAFDLDVLDTVKLRQVRIPFDESAGNLIAG